MHSAAHASRFPLRIFALVLAATVLATLGEVRAQQNTQQIFVLPGAGSPGPGGSVPSQLYFNALPAFYNGNYRDSLALFLAESGRGVRTAQTQWIDAIPYYTMAGECYYHLGQPEAALQQYDAAVKLLVAYSDWMMRIQFPPAIAPAPNAVRATPWGQSKRRAVAGGFSDTYLMSQGRVDQSQVIQQGGVIQAAVSFPVYVAEIVRTSSLALRRRAELLGPNAKHDPLTQSALETLSRRTGPPNHWSEAWGSIQQGCAQAAAGNLPQATAALERGALVAGQFDHPLTSTALVELGRIAIKQGNYAAALDYCQEATYACWNFPNHGTLEEAFRLGFLAFTLLNQKGEYPPLAPALAWAKNQSFRQLQTSLTLLAAENMILAGKSSEAAGLLDTARVMMGRSNLSTGRLGAQGNYLASIVAYQAANLDLGDQKLRQALAFQQHGSLWNFQIAVADQRHTAGTTSDRVAMQLYEELLRDPQPEDWNIDALECLSVLTGNQELALEHWFELAFGNSKDQQQAVDIADRARRHRFFRSLPMGGRLLALRWLLEGPLELLDDPGLLQRQTLLTRYPRYAQLSEQAAQIRAKLATIPLVNDAVEPRRQQMELLTSLGEISAAQEVLLREIAVRREAAEMVFPPQRKIEDVQQNLAQGQLLLVFFATNRNLYAFLYSHDRHAAWQIRSPQSVQKELANLLREMGNFDANHELAPADLTKTSWAAASTKVMNLLLDRSNVDLSGSFSQVVIVPDGPLWYLPFEVLPVGTADDLHTLVSQAQVRYAPTVGLALPFGAPQKPRPNIGVSLGKLHPQDDETVATSAFGRIGPAIPGAVALPRPLTAPANLYRVLLDGLIVLDDVAPASGPYDWTPLRPDRKGTAPLAGWFALPWGGPDKIILPGFHTAAETGFRKGRPNGEEVFLTVCGLMASGARTVLISRWRPAGQTSFDLIREFAQELPYVSPAEAWQRSIQVVSDTPLETEREPRVKDATPGTPRVKAKHPFFWAPYMLVDSGQAPADPSAPAPADPPGAQAAKAQPAGPQPAGPQRPQPAGGQPPGPRPQGAMLPRGGNADTTTTTGAISPPAAGDGAAPAPEAKHNGTQRTGAQRAGAQPRAKIVPPKKTPRIKPADAAAGDPA